MVMAMLNVAYLCSEDCKKSKWDKGFTNDIYRMEYQGEEMVLRIPKADHNLVTIRDGEIMAMHHDAIQKYDVPTIFYDDQTGIKVTKYIENASTYGECSLENKIELVAACMKSFHQEPLSCDYRFDVIAKLHDYMSQCQNFPFTFEGFEDVKAYIGSVYDEQVFCHNDWVDGNLLFDHQRLYLIDYEYSGMNHPYFDVMSFLSENEIDDEHLRERFYQIYFDGEIPYQALTQWELFEDVLWCYWAWSMYERRHDLIYQEIAEAKYNHYQSVSNNQKRTSL